MCHSYRNHYDDDDKMIASDNKNKWKYLQILNKNYSKIYNLGTS